MKKSYRFVMCIGIIAECALAGFGQSPPPTSDSPGTQPSSAANGSSQASQLDLSKAKIDSPSVENAAPASASGSTFTVEQNAHMWAAVAAKFQSGMPKEFNDDVFRALAAARVASNKRYLGLSDQMRDLMGKLMAINNKAADSHRPVADQLSRQDLDAFNLLNAQIRYLQNELAIEVSRQNSLELVENIYEGSVFVTKMQNQYIAEKGAMNPDDFEKYCGQEAAKIPGLEKKVELFVAAKLQAIDPTANPK